MNGQQNQIKLKKRKSWNAKAMELAVNAVKSKEMGYLKASKAYLLITLNRTKQKTY